MGVNGKVDFQAIVDLRDKIQKNLTGSEYNLFLESCAKELAARLLAKVVKRTPVGKGTHAFETKKVYDYWSEEGTDDKAGKRHRYDTGKTKTVQRTIKKGGTLRRGWTSGKSPSSFAQSLKVRHSGNIYSIEITNPVEYASYVEFGHRQQPGRFVPAIGKRLKQGWVEGKFMLTISEDEIRRDAPRVLENKLKKKLGEIFNG